MAVVRKQESFPRGSEAESWRPRILSLGNWRLQTKLATLLLAILLVSSTLVLTVSIVDQEAEEAIALGAARSFPIVIAALLASLLSVGVGRLVVRPILRVRDSVERFGAGERTERTDVKTADEAGQLANALNTMAESVRGSPEGLLRPQEAKGRFVRRERMTIGQIGTVGHDLRNPLVAIKNSAYFLNILLVDDDPGFSARLRNVLAKRGHWASIAATGEEALARVREKAYDILFIDMKLPTLNGLETYLAIREIAPEAVVVIMTAYTAYRQEVDDLVDRALRKGAYAFLFKPLDVEKVLRLVGGVLEQKRKTRRRQDSDSMGPLGRCRDG